MRNLTVITGLMFALVSLIPQVIHEMPAPWETPDRQVHA